MSKKTTDPKTEKQAETKKAVELKEEDLDKAQGAGWSTAPIGSRGRGKKADGIIILDQDV